jgi:hypothetical protein
MAIAIPLPIAKGGTGQAATGSEAFAAGVGSTASEEGCVAVGYQNTASTEFGVAVGIGNTANSDADVALGRGNQAIGGVSQAIGRDNIASGVGSNSFGSLNTAFAGSSSAFGNDCYGGGTRSSAFGYDNTVATTGTNSSAFGYGANVSGANSSAFGYYPKTTVNNTFEVGYWPNASTRGGGLRADSSGMAALTTASGATPLGDGGATAGSEAVGALPRGAVAFRASGDDVFVDYNNAGSIKTGAITSIRGQVSKMDSGTISGLTQDVYKTTGLTATLDSSTASGIVLGTTDTFAIKNTSGETRVVKVFASMDASAGSNQLLGVRLAKNGTSIAETECRSNTSSNNFAKLVTNWMVSLANNDEIALFVANHSGTTNISFQRGRIVAISVD